MPFFVETKAFEGHLQLLKTFYVFGIHSFFLESYSVKIEERGIVCKSIYVES